MKTCRYCNTPARSERQKYCAKCGKPFDEPEQQEEPIRLEIQSAPAKVISAQPEPVSEPESEAISLGKSVMRRHKASAPVLDTEEEKLDSKAKPEPVVPARRRSRLGAEEELANSVPTVELKEKVGDSSSQKKEVERVEIQTSLNPPVQKENNEEQKVSTSVEIPVHMADEVHSSQTKTPKTEPQAVSADVFFAQTEAESVSEIKKRKIRAQTPMIRESLEQQKSAEEKKKTSNTANNVKKTRKIVIVLLILLLVAVLVVGGFFVWKKIEESKSVIIGETSYSIEETTSLSLQSPSDEDWNSLCKLTELTSLTVVGNGKTVLSGTQIEKLAELQKLTEFSVDGVQFPDGLSALSELGTLESLSLTNCKLTSDQLNGVNLLLSLHKLNLEGNSLTDISFLQSGMQLEEINLSKNQITDYTPLASISNTLLSLDVDLCHAQTLDNLPVLKSLTVNGQKITDVSSYLTEQRSAIEQYSDIVAKFENNDFNALSVALEQLESTDTLSDTRVYANGWLMGNGSEWNVIKASLPADAKMLVVDTNGFYCGQMQSGQRSGTGVQLFAGNHSVYSGTWVNDLPNGAGIYRKTTADGTVLEFSGDYIDGLEDGTMVFKVTTATDSQSGTYTASKGTRTTVRQISDTQAAFIQFDTIYWYDTVPNNHGVAIAGIPYQEEKAVQIQPESKPAQTAASSGSKNSSSGNKGSTSGSSGNSTPQASAPEVSESSTASSGSGSWNPTPEEIRQGIQEGIQTASDIYHAAKEIYDFFN